MTDVEEYEDENEAVENDDWARSLRAFVVLFASLGLLTFATYQVWRKFGTPAATAEVSCLTADCINMPPQPTWVRGDVREEVVVQGSLGGRPLAEAGLAKLIDKAFSNHPWVKRVNFVSIESASTIRVELAFRHPAAVVVLPKDVVPVNGDSKTGLIPVDDEGVCLPTAGFSQADANRLPRVYASKTVPPDAVGAGWADGRVLAALQIIASLGPTWQALDLYAVHAPGLNGETRPQTEYMLANRDQRFIVWGSAPGKEKPNEPRFAEKLLVLKQLALDGGKLAQTGKIMFDLRTVDVNTIQSAWRDGRLFH